MRLLPLLAVLILAAATSLQVIRAWHTPAGSGAVALNFPLPQGQYLVINGGNSPLINFHQRPATRSRIMVLDWPEAQYAVDMVALRRGGMRARSIMPSARESYFIFGTPVIAPCAGTIVRAVDGLADIWDNDRDHSTQAGNHVFIRCLDAHIMLAHLKQGSVAVNVGDTVRVGDAVGQVGSSGRGSEPHLHIHAQRLGTPDQPFIGNAVPMKIEGRFLRRGHRVRGYIAQVNVRWKRPF
jgi:hypothetical protein